MRVPSRGNEWSLVFFTVLTQAAAGACVARFLLPDAVRSPRADPALGIALVLLVVGAVLGALHLARPGRARFVLANVASSPLSREVLFGLVFGAILVVHFVLLRVGGGSSTLLHVLSTAGALLGLVFVRQVSSIYQLRTVPAWNSWATPVSFLLTALVLGPLVVALTLQSTAADPSVVQDPVRWLALATAVAVGLQLLVVLLRRGPFGGRLFFACAGVALLAVATAGGRATHAGWALALAALLLFVSEVLGRARFYASYERVGL